MSSSSVLLSLVSCGNRESHDFILHCVSCCLMSLFLEISFSYNCENVVQAEVWLKEQAQKEGWSKASKLHTRPMSQGLVGVALNDKSAAVVEVPIIVLYISCISISY